MLCKTIPIRSKIKGQFKKSMGHSAFGLTIHPSIFLPFMRISRKLSESSASLKLGKLV